MTLPAIAFHESQHWRSNLFLQIAAGELGERPVKAAPGLKPEPTSKSMIEGLSQSL